MKKGDIRKQEILETAERMFCANGFEQTSVNDIIDALHTSKGSFYHHYISKESLLEAMCRKRAVQFAEETVRKIRDSKKTEDNLNLVFSGMIPFQGEKPSFLLMLLPVFNRTEGRSLKAGYCEALKEAFLPIAAEQIETGNQSMKLSSTHPAYAAEICLSLVNLYWVSVCEMILGNLQEKKKTEPADLLSLTEQYSTAIERFLLLPYGSVHLADLVELKRTADLIFTHWSDPAEG